MSPELPRNAKLEQVLANVCRGRVAYLVLTPKQNKALSDPEGRIALDVLRHLLGARPMVPERFPLAEEAFQAVARKLGYVIGQKRCRRMAKRLLNSGVIGVCGQYRQPYRNSAVRSGFHVALYKLGHRLRAPALPSESVLSASGQLSRAICPFAGGSTRSSETSWVCRRPRYLAPRCGG